MAGRISILEENLLYKGWSTLIKYIISYTRRDGTKEEQTREIYDSGDGAAVLMYNPEERKIIYFCHFGDFITCFFFYFLDDGFFWMKLVKHTCRTFEDKAIRIAIEHDR